MKTNFWRRPVRWIFLAILPIFLGGCFTYTPRVLDAAKEKTVDRTVLLRVSHAYLDGRNQLVIQGEGILVKNNVWQEADSAPRNSIWFEADLAALAATAKNGVITLPPSVLRAGQPDLAVLARDGFNEIRFVEYEMNREFYTPPVPGGPDPANGNSAAPPNPATVRVTYSMLIPTRNFPGKLGYWPKFSLEDHNGQPGLALEINEESKSSNPAAYLLLPFAAVGDAIVGPPSVILLLFAIAGGYHG